MRDTNFIYDLNGEKARRINEIDAVEQLADPEKYVETGFVLQYFDEERDNRLISLESSDFGNLVFYSVNGKL